MSPRITGVEQAPGADHEWSIGMLPWYLNGRLDAQGAQRLEQHLDACAECRAELARSREVFGALRSSGGVELAPQAGLAAVLGRIERRERRRRHLLRPLQFLFGDRSQRPFAVALALQAVVIVTLTAVLGFAWRTPPETQFRTLSTPVAVPAGGAQLRLVLADTLTLGELRLLLAPWEGRIAAGPEGRGIYTVVVQGSVDDALRSLRAQDGVLLAERVVE
jgi:anti-sigma factor RsiW